MIKRALVTLIGAGIVALSLFAPRLGWVFFELGSTNQLMMMGLGLLLIAAGVLGDRLKGRRLVRGYQTIAVLILNTLLFLLLVEMVFTIAFNVNNTVSGRRQVAAVPEIIPYYAEVPWGAQYWEEHYRVPDIYKPYLIWGYPPQDGEYVNIGEDGYRITPGADCDADDAITVYVFGGSTVWGQGSPDDMTLPAYLQTALAERADRPVCVVNRGIGAYVTTQNIIDLWQLLRGGTRPDYVLFYGGLNDVYAAYQTGQVGTHQNFEQIAANFNENGLGAALRRTVTGSSTFRILLGWVGRLTGTDFYAVGDYETMGLDRETLAQDTAAAALGNIDLLAMLAENYGFEYAFIWQPAPNVGGKPLTPFETGIVSEFSEGYRALFDRVYTLIEEAEAERDDLYSISDIFDDMEAWLWFDPSHVFPEGNAMIADRIMTLVGDDILAASSRLD